MKKFFLLLLLPVTGQAATYIQTVNAAIPDNDLTGITSTITVSGDATSIVGVQVVLNLSGTATAGWGGDIYCYLTHSSGFSVLLNRIGRSTANPAGSGNNGFGNGSSQLLTLSDSAATDIHLAPTITGAPLAGTFQSDGRNVSPTSTTAVMDAATRTANLGVFNTLDSAGTWTLFVADTASGGTMTLNSWQLTVVPEPSAAALGALSLASLVLRRRRK